MKKGLSAAVIYHFASLKNNLLTVIISLFAAILVILLFSERSHRSRLELEYLTNIGKANIELIGNQKARVELIEQLVKAQAIIYELLGKNNRLLKYGDECLANYILSRIENQKLKSEKRKFGTILKPSG